MAVVYRGNIARATSTGAIPTNRKSVKIAQLVFNGSAAGDYVELSDSASGDTLIKLQAVNAKETVVVTSDQVPITFPDGVYVKAISASCDITIIFAG